VIKPPPAAPTAPRSLPTTVQQFSIAFDSIPLHGMSPTERAKVLTHLAVLLMQAAGVATAERDDDER
jgi:hypothetical protein